MSSIDPRTPILVGGAQFTQRTAKTNVKESLNPIEMMAKVAKLVGFSARTVKRIDDLVDVLKKTAANLDTKYNDLRGQFGSHDEIKVQIQCKQRTLRCCVGLHVERYRHGHGEIVTLIVEIKLVAEVPSLSALAHDHDTGIVQNRRTRQRPVRTQDAHTRQCGQVVALVGSQRAQQRNHPLLASGG